VIETESLKGRVDQAVEQLCSVHDARRSQNQNLTNLLGSLEEKFKARTVELDYCHTKIDALTQDNSQLSELLERLIGLIENEPAEVENDPLFRASTMAATLLEGWSADAASDPVPDDGGVFSLGDMAFEDVSDQELAAESLDAPEGEVSDLVASAIAAARSLEHHIVQEAAPEPESEPDQYDAVDEPIVVDIEIPDTDMAAQDYSSGSSGQPDDVGDDAARDDTEASIRDMMARLEKAARDPKFALPDDGETPAPAGSEQAA
jgi:hypothetical protein